MEARIKRNIIILVVITFLVLVGMSAGWFFALVRPQKEKLAETEQKLKKEKEDSAKLADALLAQRVAEDKLLYVKEELRFFQYRFRSFDFGNIRDPSNTAEDTNTRLLWERLIYEYSAFYGRALRRELISAANFANVRITTNFTVKKAPGNPENIEIPTYGLMVPTESELQVTVFGDLPDIMRFFNRINKSSILFVVSNINFTSTGSPLRTTQAGFGIKPYMLARGDAIQIGVKAPEAKLAAGGAPPAGGPPGTPGLAKGKGAA